MIARLENFGTVVQALAQAPFVVFLFVVIIGGALVIRR